MRGTFVLVVAAGIAAAVGWSLVRQGASDHDVSAVAVPDAPSPGDITHDPGDAVTAPGREPAPAAADGTDPVGAARALLSTASRGLPDATARAQAARLGDSILKLAETLPTRDGTEARLLARRLFAAVYDSDDASRAERDLALDRSRVLFDVLVKGNGAPPEIVLRHKVEPGQSVWALSKGPWRQAGASVAPGFILWINGVSDARRIRAGQILKVPLERLTVLIRKRSFELTVLLGGAPVDRFPVAVGADAKTPVGGFQVGDCLKNPDWYVNGRRIPFGSPGHIIGTRWIGLTGTADADGIGIHGTNDDASIGTSASQGCVRLRNADVERIFDWLAAGTQVEIRD